VIRWACQTVQILQLHMIASALPIVDSKSIRIDGADSQTRRALAKIRLENDGHSGHFAYVLDVVSSLFAKREHGKILLLVSELRLSRLSSSLRQSRVRSGATRSPAGDRAVSSR